MHGKHIHACIHADKSKAANILAVALRMEDTIESSILLHVIHIYLVWDD